MAYVSKRGRRPNENASKSSHSHVINDKTVQKFLESCRLPRRAEDVSTDEHVSFQFEPLKTNPIKHIIAIDGGYTEVIVENDFPSSKICFFQFGALIFSVSDLENLEQQAFIDPTDMSKLKKIQRLKLTLPVKNISLQDESTLTHSVRRALYDFFKWKMDNRSLMEALKWLVFEDFLPSTNKKWNLARCPYCGTTNIELDKSHMTSEYTFVNTHANCSDPIYLTDTFRLHEAIDDELGAGGILGYVTTAIEQIILVYLIKLILDTKPSLLHEFLFIKDGPLAFFGQTANIFKPMRSLVNFLFEKHNLYLAGLEKSGAFVDHADEISQKLNNNQVLLLDNDYIYRYILPGKADPTNPYGRTTYYGNKLIFKTEGHNLYVVSLPTGVLTPHPQKSDFNNLDVILTNLSKLKCDMYDSALIPVALANKLVSLANHPSSAILQNFATNSIGRT